MSDLKIRLANLCHKQWSGWMKYLFDKSIKNEDGTVTIPKWAVDRWERQVNTDYKDLSKEERESDIKEARKFIKLIEEHFKVEVEKLKE